MVDVRVVNIRHVLYILYILFSLQSQCCEKAFLCASVSLNARIVQDKRPIFVHGEYLRYKASTKNSRWAKHLYTNHKKGVVAKIVVDERGRIKAAMRYADGR